MKSEKGEENANSFSLKSGMTAMRSLAGMRVRLVSFLTKVEPENTSRFGSCNEFTMGMTTNETVNMIGAQDTNAKKSDDHEEHK